jgi:hypothetical protein
MADYVLLNNFGGRMKYEGLEFDQNVPKELEITSPGGVASTTHHWTKGFYGQGGSSTDKFGNSDPYYLYGPEGAIYNKGDSEQKILNGSRTSDKRYWNNESGLNVSQTKFDRKINDNGFVTEYYEGTTKVDDDLDLLIKKMCPCKNLKPGEMNITFNPWVVFLVFLVAYVVLDLWASAGRGLIKDKLHNGKKLGTMDLVFYAIIFTVILVVVAKLVNIPVTHFEQV